MFRFWLVLIVCVLLPAQVLSADYVIGDGDSLNVSVWGVPELSVTTVVRPDGKITLPAVGDVVATGLTPVELSRDLTKVLESYVKKDSSFAYPVSGGELKLEARFNSGAAYHLTESKLASDQTLKHIDDENHILTATVPDSSEIRWWLLGFGDQVEVLGPAKLREEFAEIARKLSEFYS
jgi:hypothetical protein